MTTFVYVVYLAVNKHGKNYDSYIHISILKKLCVGTGHNGGSLSSICREHHNEIESKLSKMNSRLENQELRGQEWRQKVVAQEQVILKSNNRKVNEIHDIVHRENPSSPKPDNHALFHDNGTTSSDVKLNNVIELLARRRTTPTFTKRPLDNRKPQQCRVPNLDPFHRQAMQYASFKWRERCTLRWRKSRVEKGVLKVDLKNVKSVTLNYIKRIHDEENWLDERPVYNRTGNTEGE